MRSPVPFLEDGEIVIYHGNCLEIMPHLDRQFADLIVTDPPYGMNRFATDGKDYLDSVGPALQMAWRRLKDGGAMFVFASTGEIVRLSNAVGLNPYRVLWLYKPNDCTFPLKGWLLKSEAILWFQKEGPSLLVDRHPFRHDCYVHTAVGQEGVEGHPTVKPIAVIKDLVSRCPYNGLVFDPFMGSGTTLRAAKDLQRQAIGIDVELRYCEIAAKRLAQEVIKF